QFETRARNYRTLEQRAPRIVSTITRLGDAAGVGRAVMLGQLGRCFLMGGCPDFAGAQFRAALDVTARLGNSEHVQKLHNMLRSKLTEALTAMNHNDETLKIAQEMQKPRGKKTPSHQL